MPVYLGNQKVSIFGATGGTALKTQVKTVSPSESQQTISPDSGYDALNKVVVNAISKTYVGSGVTKKTTTTYTPQTSDQVISSGVYLSGPQTIKGDSNLVAGNIKNGVTIFGVTGTVITSSAPNMQTKTITPSALSQTIKPDNGYDGLSQVIVNGDSNLVSSNILEGVKIFGVDGSAAFKKYYTGIEAPDSSLGNDGDLYLQIGG